MKKTCLILCLLLCASVVFCEQIANVHRFAPAPAIDGVLNDECYKNCAVLSYFLSLSDSAIGENKDKVYVGYDDKNLYFGIDCVCPKFVASSENEKGGDVWCDDDIELYIQPSLDSKDYFMIGMNGANSLYVGHGFSAVWFDTIEYKSIKSENGWTGEIAVPLKELGISTLGEIGFNICGAKQKDNILFTWSDLYGGTFHNPERFGRLSFDDSIPAVRLDLIDLSDKTLNIKATADQNDIDYTIKLKEEVRNGKADKNVDIKETFENPFGKFRLNLSKNGKTVYQSDFAAGILKLTCKQNGNKVTVILDSTNAMIEKYKKIEFRLQEANNSEVRKDVRIFYGENFAYTEPFYIEKTYILPHRGEYEAVLETWGFSGLSKKLVEKIVY